MAAVRIEEVAFGDVRFVALGEIAGYNEHEALGRMARLWRYCTQQNTYFASEAMVRACLGPRGVEALVGSELGQRTPEGIRVRGTASRVEWLKTYTNGSVAGGVARAESAQRDESGKFVPRQTTDLPSDKPADKNAGETLEPATSPITLSLATTTRENDLTAAPEKALTEDDILALCSGRGWRRKPRIHDIDRLRLLMAKRSVTAREAAEAIAVTDAEADHPGFAFFVTVLDGNTRRIQRPSGTGPPQRLSRRGEDIRRALSSDPNMFIVEK